jgi:hypothetical protein
LHAHLPFLFYRPPQGIRLSELSPTKYDGLLTIAGVDLRIASGVPVGFKLENFYLKQRHIN